MDPKLFDTLIQRFSATTAFQVADIYEAFEELEVSLDKARNDVKLDKLVRVGANPPCLYLASTTTSLISAKYI